MADNTRNDLNRLQEVLGYYFNDINILTESLTHRSFANENPVPTFEDNERLEFLGDAVVNLVLSDLLIKKFPKLLEGPLSRIRAGQVNEKNLALLAERLGLGGYLAIGKGEEQTGGRQKPSLLADALEAILGGVYLDGGFEAARSVIARLFRPCLTELQPLTMDFKTLLQEFCQARLKTTPIYRDIKEEGPDHRKTFFVEVSVQGKIISNGKGGTKKEAQQRAAEKAFQSLADQRTE
ncbi:MAG: ribonuclease III [Thermodesulfobacteriota bacterium]